jgi:hypothetical protein
MSADDGILLLSVPIESHALKPVVEGALDALGQPLPGVVGSNARAALGDLKPTARIRIALRNKLVKLGLDVRLQVLDSVQGDA